MDDKFKIKSYGYGELAQMYFSTIARQSATVQFRRWIRINNKLLDELSLVGFKRYQKMLTPKQVEIIVRYIGEP